MSDLAALADEQRKRDAVLAALQDCAMRGLLGVWAAMHGIAEHRLAQCARDDSLGVLTQSEIDWLAVDLIE